MGCIPNCTVSDSQLSSKNPRTLKGGTFIISQGARPECPRLLVHSAHTVTSLTFLPTRLCWHRWPYMQPGNPQPPEGQPPLPGPSWPFPATFSFISARPEHHPLAFLHTQPISWPHSLLLPNKSLPIPVEGHPKMKTSFKCQFPSDLTWEISLPVFNDSCII